MDYFQEKTPLGPVLLAADDTGLCGLWFEGSRYAPELPQQPVKETPSITAARRWLALYFSGQEPDFTPPLHLCGTTFQRAVWALLLTIPYGKTVTYNALASQLAHDYGRSRPAPQAVGGAVGRNPVSLIVPCHRVVGASGSLTGYAGGLRRKEALLRLEKADMSRLFLPDVN